jgi:uncharacterized protein
MKPLELIHKFFKDNHKDEEVLVFHLRAVAEKSLDIAKKIKEPVDLKFLEEAALLHDIGVSRVQFGKDKDLSKPPYIAHGYLGREILEKEGFPRHALVAERHVGSGLTKEEAKILGLPEREMLPIAIEEKIVCVADKFYSKSHTREEDIQEIRDEFKGYGGNALSRFDQYLKELNIEY